MGVTCRGYEFLSHCVYLDKLGGDGSCILLNILEGVQDPLYSKQLHLELTSFKRYGQLLP
jgi:hypothetical protein